MPGRGASVLAIGRRPEGGRGTVADGVDEPDLGTGRNGWGCFVPDLTRLAALPCEEARHFTF